MNSEKENQPKFKNQKQRALIEVRTTAQFIGQIMESSLGKFELSAPQFNILRILRGAGKSLNMQSVKERMIEVSPNATRLMDKLFDKGLISRIRCAKDRRVVYVEITKLGLDLLLQVDEDSDWKKMQTLQDKLTEAEADSLIKILTKICFK